MQRSSFINQTSLSFIPVTLEIILFFKQENKPSLIQTGPEATLQTHLLVFEAEKSRKENRVVCLEMAKELFPKPTYK